MKISHEISLASAKRTAAESKLLRYGANTCWWGMDDAPWYKKPGTGLPCDPRGGMLFQTDNPLDFIAHAELHPEHYGKYGLRTFLLALHGCVTTDIGTPTAFSSWKEYEDLIDAAA